MPAVVSTFRATTAYKTSPLNNVVATVTITPGPPGFPYLLPPPRAPVQSQHPSIKMKSMGAHCIHAHGNLCDHFCAHAWHFERLYYGTWQELPLSYQECTKETRQRLTLNRDTSWATIDNACRSKCQNLEAYLRQLCCRRLYEALSKLACRC